MYLEWPHGWSCLGQLFLIRFNEYSWESCVCLPLFWFILVCCFFHGCYEHTNIYSMTKTSMVSWHLETKWLRMELPRATGDWLSWSESFSQPIICCNARRLPESLARVGLTTPAVRLEADESGVSPTWPLRGVVGWTGGRGRQAPFRDQLTRKLCGTCIIFVYLVFSSYDMQRWNMGTVVHTVRYNQQ